MSNDEHGKPASEAKKRQIAEAKPGDPPWGKGYYGSIEHQDPANAAGWQGGPEGGWQDGKGSDHGEEATDSEKREIAGAKKVRARR